MNVLGQPLESEEQVLYVGEKNMKLRRVIYSVVGFSFLIIAVISLSTIFIPIVMTVFILLCFYLGITPPGNTPVAWVLTTDRFLEVYLDSEGHQSKVTSIKAIKEITPIREKGPNGGGIIASIVMIPIRFIFNLVRDAIQDRNEKISEKYWAQAKGISIEYTDGSTGSIDCAHEPTIKKVGVLISKILDPEVTSPSPQSKFPLDRTQSLL